MLAAIHVIHHPDRVAFSDTGNNDSLPNALAAPDKLGLDVTAVDYVIPTHIHLDHAGGFGAKMQAFAEAKLVIHPRAARHMAEPPRLVAGVEAVYNKNMCNGCAAILFLYRQNGLSRPPESNPISLAGRQLTCIDTPEYARHRICVCADTCRKTSSGTGNHIATRRR